MNNAYIANVGDLTIIIAQKKKEHTRLAQGATQTIACVFAVNQKLNFNLNAKTL